MAVGTTNYPTSLDTVVELVEAANNAADQLSGNISDSATSLTLMDGSEFAQSGIVAIDNELLSYTSRTGNTLNGLVRGIEGTTAAAHTDMSAVRQVITAASHNVQSAAIIALENKLGTGTDIAWSKMAPLTTNRMLVSDAGGDVAVSLLTHDATNAVIGNIGGLDFDTTPTATPTTARMVWDDTHGTVNLTLKGGTVGVDIGQTTVARVVNKTVTNINLLRSNYQVVRIVSAQGQRLAISLAQGNSEPNSTDVIGLVAEDIANNQEGFIVVRGLITEINTTGSLQGETWADGDILYLSPTTAGGLTKVEPQAPNHLVIVGYVVYAHSQHGKIYVAIQTSWETKELHDVKITGTPVAGSLLIRNATTGVWENATLTAGSNITITNADKSITINSTASGSGDVVGPSSATDNALARFDTTTGKLIQNSLITLSDAGALSFPDGVRQTFNPNGTNAGINVGAHTSDPSSPTNGDLWYNSTANQLKTRRGAATEVVATIPANLGDEIPVLNATTGNLSATGEVFWDGSGNALQIGNASTGALRLVNATGTDSFTLLPPASGGAVTLTLPPGIGSNGQALTSNGTGGTSWTTITAGVSSVSGTSPVVSSGGSTPAISLASGYGDTQNPYASKTANNFLAAPNGTAGAPTFRAIVAADIPPLNQNTTGTASNVTGTVAIANGGTGATTAPNALTNLGAYPASNPNGYTSNTGTVTSVGGTGTVNGITLTGSVSTTGNLTLGGTLSGVSLTTQVTGTLPVANGGTGVTTSTGTGSVVLSNSPTLVTPSLGTATGTSFNGITGLSSTTPVADSGIGLVGTATTAARADHAHPVSGVTTISGGTTGLTPSTASSGAVTLAGTLGVANGGTGATTAGAARTNLGATTVGGNLFTLTNPGAVTFPRFNADNTVSALTDTAFRTAIGAGTVTGVTASSPLSSSGGATPNLSLGTVPVANGGTGVTTVSSGQLLIGTSAGGFAASTLTAGSNVTITNGSGTITIAASSGATPGGSDTQVQFNDGGSALGGDAGFTYNKTTNTATVEQLNLGTAGSARGILRLRGNTSGEITVQPAATAGTYTLTLPGDDGNANQVLTTDGTGVLSWSTPSSGGRTTLTANRTYYVGFDLGTCTISNASPGVVTLTGHGLSANDPVIFSTTGTLPAPLIAGAVYYVKSVLTANTFTVSLTSGGTVINTTSAGSGTHRVRTGKDTQDGLTSSRTGAFLTVQKAIDTIAALDLSSFAVTVQLARGRYVDTVRLASYTGAGPVTILGNASSVADTVLQPYSLGSVTCNATTGVIEKTAHGLVAGTPIQLFTFGSAPTGLSMETTYYVGGTVNANDFQIFDAPNGNRVTWTTNGSSVVLGGYAVRAVSVLGKYVVKGVTIASSNGLYGARINQSTVEFDTIDLSGSTAADAHLWAEVQAAVTLVGSNTVSAGAGYAYICTEASFISSRTSTMTMVGTPAFSKNFCFAARLGCLLFDQTTFSGSATGSYYLVASNSVLQATLANLPGNSAGTEATGGRAINV